MATSKEALAKFDKIVAEIRGKSEPPTEFSDPDEVTSRLEVEEIARSAVENAIRAKEPSQPVIENHVHIDRPSSSPPSVRKRGNTLLGIAAIITALGGAAGVQQCAGQARTVGHGAAPKP